jgi:MFS family permease
VLSPALFYLFGITALSVSLGIQIILLPWLVVDSLALTSVWVGWVQAAVLVPNLLLLLVGGVMADKGKGVSYLVPLLLMTMLIHGALVIIIANSWLSIVLLLSYAVLLGVANAFIQPWREYLLKQASSSEEEGCLQPLIAKSSLCLYLGQGLGVLLVSFAEVMSITLVLMCQMLMVATAIVSFVYMHKRIRALNVASSFPQQNVSPSQDSASISILLNGGLQEVWMSPVLRSLMTIMAFNGFFHIGVFIVSLPLLAQQVYGATVNFYSSLQLAFVAGMVTITLIILYRGPLDFAGRRILFGLLYGGVILLALGAKPTLAGLFILLFFWGVVVGISANLGRAVIQRVAPEASRGRIISIYQLALFGCAPLGALFAGYGIEQWGVLTLLRSSGIASLLMFMGMLTTRALWEVELNEQR